MSWAHLLAFNLTLLAAMASPGPAFLIAMRSSLTGGFLAGAATGLGLATVAALWTAMALFGLSGLFSIVPWTYLVLKTAGAIYLLWIAYHMWRDARAPLPAREAMPVRHAFRTGALVNLANPKSVLFAGAVLVLIFPPDLFLWERLVIVANHFIVEAVVYAGFAGFLSTAAARDAYLRAKTILDRVAAGVLGALGLRLLFDHSR